MTQSDSNTQRRTLLWVLAAIAVGAAASPPHGVIWLAGEQVWFAAVMLIAIAAAVYATVAAYTDLPVAWGAWSVR